MDSIALFSQKKHMKFFLNHQIQLIVIVTTLGYTLLNIAWLFSLKVAGGALFASMLSQNTRINHLLASDIDRYVISDQTNGTYLVQVGQ